MEWHADVAKSLAQDPLFQIATHSYLYPHFPTLTEKAMRLKFEKTLAVHQCCLPSVYARGFSRIIRACPSHLMPPL